MSYWVGRMPHQKRRIVLVLAGVAAGALLAGSAAPTTHAAARNVLITSLPASVTQGGTEHVNALVVGGPLCTLSVRYADGKPHTLGKQSAAVFHVAWTWRVPPTAPPGAAHLSLACGRAGQAIGSFTVRKRHVPSQPPAQVVATKTGLAQVPHAADDGTDISYGIVLVNESSADDALDIQVGVNLLDSAKRVVGSDTRSIVAIPAGGTYYLGGAFVTHDRTAVTSVQPIIRVGAGKAKSIRAPAVSNIRISEHNADSGAYVDGQVTNEASATLSSDATVSAVFFDAAGRVIGGGTTVPPFALPPGAAAAWEISTPVEADAIASVRASVEPRYGS
jgi:hypothetical protein